MITATNIFRFVTLIQVVFFLSIKDATETQPIVSAERVGGSDSDNYFSIMTLNMWGLPVNLRGHDQANRFHRIPEAIYSAGYDIVCLQEAFSPKLRHELLSFRNDTYFTYSQYDCNKTRYGLVTLDCYGGLMTLSRFPIVYEQFFPFPRVENMNVVERIAKKGFLVSEIIRNGKSIFVINTHLYAGLSNNAESIRLQQIDFLQRTLNSIVPADGIVLMAGDINSNPRNIELSQDLPKEFVHNYIMEEMDFIDPGYQESNELCTIQSGVNAYQTEKEPKQKLDYIFYRCEKQGTSLQTVNHRLLFKNEDSISDHLALGVELLICQASQ